MRIEFKKNKYSRNERKLTFCSIERSVFEFMTCVKLNDFNDTDWKIEVSQKVSF